MELARLEVVIERDVAYASAVLKAEAVSKGEVRQTGTRSYACTWRLLKGKDGRWLLDLATATEGAR
jgi:ketosteroid isomerase-like protein